MFWTRCLTERFEAWRPAVAALSLVLVFAVVAIVFNGRDKTVAEPGPATASIVPASLKQCRDCHQQEYDDFQKAPHLHTLQPANSAAMRTRFAGKPVELPGVTFEFQDQGGQLLLGTDVVSTTVPFHWIFGSGQHAQTPVSVWENSEGRLESIESILSWYPRGAGLAPTLGSSDAPPARGSRMFGTHWQHAKTLDCFGCHVTYLPRENGNVVWSELIAGVQCERCHRNTAEHASGKTGFQMERWSELDPLESIHRCGECHRRDDELPADELVPTNPLLLRFAPVGLSQSRCFQEQAAFRTGTGEQMRMDCLTCHNPHLPAETNPEHYRQRCLECHGSGAHQASQCNAQPMTSQCLDCHMPKLQIQDHLTFTDHWIRVRKKPEDAQ